VVWNQRIVISNTDPTVFEYSNTQGCFFDPTFYPEQTSTTAKPRPLYLIVSQYADEIGEFIELIEREKAYHKSRELSLSGKISNYKSKSTIPAKRKIAIDPERSSSDEAANLISTDSKRAVVDWDSLGPRLKRGYRISQARSSMR
jgi:hypothetical protein